MVFNSTGDIIFGGTALFLEEFTGCSKTALLIAVHQINEDDDFEESRMRSPFGSSFRTFDASDYTLIGK